MSIQKKTTWISLAFFSKPDPSLLETTVENSQVEQVSKILPALTKLSVDDSSGILFKAFYKALELNTKQVEHAHEVVVRIFAFACRYYPQQLLKCQDKWNTLLPNPETLAIYKVKRANPCAYLFKGLYEYLQEIKYQETLLKSSPYLLLIDKLTVQGWAAMMEKYGLYDKRLDQAPKGITGWTLAQDIIKKHYLCAKRTYIYNILLEHLPPTVASIVLCPDDIESTPTKRMMSSGPTPSLQGYYI